MAHPQNSPRGLFAKDRIDVGSYSITYDSTSLMLSGAVEVTGAVTASGNITASGQAVYGLLSANSTALILPNSVRVGSKASYISSNSTGIKIGTRYISTNTTGNSTT